MRKVFTILLLVFLFLNVIGQTRKPPPKKPSTGGSQVPKWGPSKNTKEIIKLQGEFTQLQEAIEEVKKSRPAAASSSSSGDKELWDKVYSLDTLVDSFLKTADLSEMKGAMIADTPSHKVLQTTIEDQNEAIEKIKKDVSEFKDTGGHMGLLILIVLSVIVTVVLFLVQRKTITNYFDDEYDEDDEDDEDDEEDTATKDSFRGGLQQEVKMAINKITKQNLENVKIAEDRVMRAKQNLEGQIAQLKDHFEKEIKTIKKS